MTARPQGFKLIVTNLDHAPIIQAFADENDDVVFDNGGDEVILDPL